MLWINRENILLISNFIPSQTNENLSLIIIRIGFDIFVGS